MQQPPRKPTPPENYKICGNCGFKAKESDYSHNCNTFKYVFLTLILSLLSTPVIALIVNLTE